MEQNSSNGWKWVAAGLAAVVVYQFATQAPSSVDPSRSIPDSSLSFAAADALDSASHAESTEPLLREAVSEATETAASADPDSEDYPWRSDPLVEPTYAAAATNQSGAATYAPQSNDSAYQRNLQSCLNGYSTLCNPSLIAESDRPRVADAAYQRNLRACLNGYSSQCNEASLRNEDRPQVATARYDRNLRSCLNGYSSLCNESLLRAEDRPAVTAAAYQRNLTACRNGYNSLCRLDRLTAADAEAVATVRNSGGSTYAGSEPNASSPSRPVYGCAENGSCYGDISAATGRPRTVAVRGYYRRDGTYVRGHYRSPPRRR